MKLGALRTPEDDDAYTRLMRSFASSIRPIDEDDPLLQDAVRRARTSFRAFIELVRPSYYFNWHHEVIISELERFARKEVLRLMLFMPPQHGKSELVSRLFPAWMMGLNPDIAFMGCSYNDFWAKRFNRDVQRLIDTDIYSAIFPETRLYSKMVRATSRGTWMRNTDLFEIVGRRGVYRSAGIGAGIAGQPFDYGILDDPIKDAKEANSTTYRERVDEWYSTVFHARQSGNASILLTVTRWHEDDLPGRLLRRAESNPDADQWDVIKFPAVAEGDLSHQDPRQQGEFLWPNKYSEKEYKAKRAANSPYKWSAVYQQNPHPVEGGVLNQKHFRYFRPTRVPGRKAGDPTVLAFQLLGSDRIVQQTVLAHECLWFQTCDTAQKTNEENDYTVISTWALTPGGNLLLYHVWRGRIPIPQQFPALMSLREGPRTGMPFPDGDTEEDLKSPWRGQDATWPVPLSFQSVEEKASGIGILQQARAAGRALKALDAGQTDKVARGGTIATMYGQGKVYHLEHAPWVADYEYEILRFPTGAHDDQFDTAAYAGILADRDKLLRAFADREILVYPQPDEIEDGNQVFEINGHRVEFEDERDWHETGHR